MNEISDKTFCIYLSDRQEIWINEEKAKRLKLRLSEKDLPAFIDIDGTFIKTFSIMGIFTPEQISEKKELFNGNWRCKYGVLHGRYQKCDCKRYRNVDDLPELKNIKNERKIQTIS